MTSRDEARQVYQNLAGDHRQVAEYLIARCGDFLFDHERADFIAEFLLASADAALLVGVEPPEKKIHEDDQSRGGKWGRPQADLPRRNDGDR